MSASSSPPLNRNLSAIFSTPNPQAGGMSMNQALPAMAPVGYNIPPPPPPAATGGGGGRKRKQPPGPPVDPSLAPPGVDANQAPPQLNAPVAPVAPVHAVGPGAPGTSVGPAAMSAAPGAHGAPAPPGAPGMASGQQAPQAPQAQQPHAQQPPQTPQQSQPQSQQQQGQQQQPSPAQPGSASVASPPTAKKSRTNTPWSPAEEQRLKQMRDAGNSWSEIAKTFPTRTEGSVKKHWYKDMHYAEFAEDESAALLAAIKEYETSKWKVIGQKVGKPAKACEQYAKEHFGNKT